MANEIKELFGTQKILIQIKRQGIKNAFINYQNQKTELQKLKDMIAKELGIKEEEFPRWEFDDDEKRLIKKPAK